MGAKPLPDSVLLQTLEAVERNDFNNCRAARDLGISESTVRRQLRELRGRGLHLSGGAREAMTATRLSGAEISGGYRHVYDDDGKKTETVRWAVPKQEMQLETVLERATSAFSSLPPAPPIPEPSGTNLDLLTLYPLFDVHYGMHAWGKETGYEDYDIRLASDDIHKAFGNVMSLSPDSEEAIVLIGGDFFHGDDSTNQTPAHHNPLDVDGRHFKVLDTGIELVAASVERVATKHRRVKVRVLRGNHDPHSHMVLTLALSQRYRDNDRITVEKDPRDIFMYQFGKCLIAAHHGDKQKPEQLAMILAEICPFWSASPHRIVFTGHRHSQQTRDFPGIVWEQFRAFCPPDAFGAQFAPRRAMHAITFNKSSGIAIRALDPIRRAA